MEEIDLIMNGEEQLCRVDRNRSLPLILRDTQGKSGSKDFRGAVLYTARRMKK